MNKPTGARVTVPLYALALENDHRRGTAFVDAVHEEINHQNSGRPGVVAGDSAGSNFALTLRKRGAGLALPHRLVLFAPWLDLTLRDERARQLEPRDVMLGVNGLRQCGRWWAGQLDPAVPHMSPLHADLSGLPPMALFQGDWGILVAYARSFAAHAAAASVQCSYEEYPGGFHVFMAASFMPEAKVVFR